MSVPLAALLRRVSRMAEQMFDKQGDVDPLWLIENADGEQTGLITPIITSTPLAAAEEKDRIAAEVRTLFAEKGIVRYARAMEGWKLVDYGKNMTKEQAAIQYAAMGYTLANHPDRRELVALDAEDGTEALTAFRDIIRPAHGKPYLGKLGAIERMDSVEGRWLGLLPDAAHAAAARERPPEPPPRYVRWSSELPDDVGTVFVTAVPGAPIQLTGRHDPANGELCVGSIMRPGKDAPWPPPVEELAWVEIVTGPEAERLILSVHGYLTAQADAAGLTFEEYMARNRERDEPEPAQ
jgi:hypothetical protein